MERKLGQGCPGFCQSWWNKFGDGSAVLHIFSLQADDVHEVMAAKGQHVAVVQFDSMLFQATTVDEAAVGAAEVLDVRHAALQKDVRMAA
jgi:hypothetical protein